MGRGAYLKGEIEDGKDEDNERAIYNVLLAERLAALKSADSLWLREDDARRFSDYHDAANLLFALMRDLIRHGRTVTIKLKDGSCVEIKEPGYIYAINTSRAYWYTGAGHGGYEMTAAKSVEVN